MSKAYDDQIRRQKHDADLKARQERERRIAERKSLANIQRNARAEAIELKVREQHAKNALAKAKHPAKRSSRKKLHIFPKSRF
jgi:hypothetical protein